jgi:hypothetical protein
MLQQAQPFILSRREVQIRLAGSLILAVVTVREVLHFATLGSSNLTPCLALLAMLALLYAVESRISAR